MSPPGYVQSGYVQSGYVQSGYFSVTEGRKAAETAPTLVLSTVIIPGEKTSEGLIVLAAAVPWFKIVEILQRDPEEAYRIDWRVWEGIVAAAWSEWGKRFDAEVILTPASGDGGKDVIVRLPGHGSVMYMDQVKAYKPGHLVTLEQVDAMRGAMQRHPAVSKGIITTTSDFAPGVWADEKLRELMPTRLLLRPRDALFECLSTIAAERGDK
jgi:restriction system protein